MKKALLIVGLSCWLLFAFAQEHDPEWWAKKHNWDGVTHWTSYMKIKPKYLGPSALPVPEIQEASADTCWSIELRPETHLNSGDFTANVFGAIKAPLGKRASFECFIVPIEYYNISDTLIRDERMIRTQNPKGWGGGDFWVGTHIQLIKGSSKLPDVLLSSYWKSASGLKLSHARFTDAPGYTFFLSVGDDMKFDSKKESSLRWYVNAGMYIWQQYDGQHLQNDAFNYGAGLRYQARPWIFKLGMAGYAGYLGNGDKPLVIRAELAYSKFNWTYALKYQYGAYDFPYQSIGFSFKYAFVLKPSLL